MAQPNPKQHYRLSLDKAIADYKDGIITATGLVYYTVGIYRAPGQNFRIKDVEAFCQELGLGLSTFYKAVSRLQLKGRMNMKAISGLELCIPASNVVEIQSGQEVSTIVESDSTIVESDSTIVESDSTIIENDSTIIENDSTIIENDSTIIENDSTNGELDSTDRENQSLELSEINGSSDSSTILSNTSQIIYQSTTTSSNEKEKVVVVGENSFSEENGVDWLTGIKARLREIRISPENVKWTFSQFSKNVIEDAIAYTGEQKWAYKPAAVYVKACRDEQKPEGKSACEDQFSAPPEPDEATLIWFKELKDKAIIKDFYTQPSTSGRYRILVVDTGASLQYWWEVVETLKKRD